MNVLVCHLVNLRKYRNIDTLTRECNFHLESFAAKSLLQVLRKRIIGMVVDESHCVVKWQVVTDEQY